MFVVVVIAIWIVAMLIWGLSTRFVRRSDIDRVKSRLLGTTKVKKKASEGPSLIRTDVQGSRWSVEIMKRLKVQVRLQALLEQAGMKIHASRLIQTCVIASLCAFAAAWLFLPSHLQKLAFLVGLVAGLFPLWTVFRKKKSRLKRFEELFPESLEFVARSMRAGHAFSVSLEMIHREFQEPLAGEFRRTFEEHNLGLPLEVALQKLAKRVPSLDVHFFVSAVLLQKRTGGNLAEILDKLAYVIRERFKLRGRIRAISAHGRMTGIALTCIPIGVAVLMFYTNPDYVKFFFTDEIGNIMLGAAVLLQVIGYLIIKQIVKIEV